ncbi:MAG: glycoside hydrolase family 28 protein [Phycisphaerae bacterium]
MLKPFLSIVLLAASARAAAIPNLTPDGKTLNTAPLQIAIDDCSRSGGGTLEIPAGRYLTGTLLLKDNVTLHLDKNATLLGSPNITDYRPVDLFHEGTGKPSGLFLIGAVDAKNVALEGEGTIDGQGSTLQKGELPIDGKPTRLRPFLVRWVRSDHVAVKGLHLQSAAMWCMHISQSKNVTVDGLTINNRGNGNNDGIDLDSSDTVSITNCDIDSHDDAMCLKATGTTPCSHITIDHCRLKSDCAAIKFGTESLGDFENIRISRCQIRDTRLAGIKLLSVDGANIQHVTISDITMDGVNTPIFLRLGARLKTFHDGDKPKTPGHIRDVQIKNLHVTNAKTIAFLMSGIPGHSVGPDISLDNIDIHLTPSAAPEKSAPLPEKENAYPEIGMFGKSFPAAALYFRHIDGITLKNVNLTLDKPDPRPLAGLDDAHHLTIEDSSLTPATLHQENNCSGINWKIVQRIPVKIQFHN